jgi:hypothetical protein
VKPAGTMLNAGRRTFLKLVAAVAAAFPVAKVSAAAEGEAGEFFMLHLAGGRPCGHIALLMVENPGYGAPLRSSQFRHLDGSRIQPPSRPMCDHCHTTLVPARHGIRKRIGDRLAEVSIPGKVS